MADYENTVGIQLAADFEQATNQVRRLNSVLNVLDSNIKGISNRVNLLKNSFERLNKVDFSNLNSKIGTLKNTIDTMSQINSSGVVGKLDQLKQALDKLQGLDVSNINKLKQIPKAMESIAKIDAKKVGEVFSTLATQVQPFIAKLKEASDEIKGLASVTDAIKKFHKEMEKAKIKTEELGQKANKTGSKLKSMFTVGNMIYLFNMSKRFFDFINTSIKKSIDFRETENLFATAMGNMKQESLKLSNTLGEVFGLSIPDMMQAQGTFKNMLSSIKGLAEESSTMLSGVLTKMSIDFASLYNVSIDNAITKMQAALSRQVRPIRSTSGYDITQNVLGSSLEQIGIYDRTVSQLSEMEKRLLIIYTLQQQMGNSGALGDFAKTIEQPAQQLKILEQQIKEVGRWLGAVFEGTIGRILPYINAFTMVVKELLKAFALLVGYKMPDSNRGANILDMMDDTAEDFGVSLGNGIDKATEKVKNLLAPFDKVNVIAKPNESSSGGSGGVSAGGIDSRILDAINDYNNGLDSVSMKATQIRNRILEWLGFTQQVNEETGEITWVLEEGYTNLEKIRDFIVGTFAIITGFKLFSKLTELYEKIDKLKDTKAVKSLIDIFKKFDDALFGTNATTTIVVAAIIGALVDLWQNNEEWRNKAVEAWNNVKDVLKSFYDNFFKPIFDSMSNTFTNIWEKGLKPLWEQWVNFVDIASSAILDLWNFVSPYLQQFCDWLGIKWKDAMEESGADAEQFALTFIGAFNLLLAEFNLILGVIIELVKALFTGDWKTAWENIKKIAGDTFEALPTDLQTNLLNMVDKVKNWFKQKIAPWFTKAKWVEVSKGIKDGLYQSMKNAVNSGIALFNKFIDAINKKMKLSWKDFSILGQTIFKAGSFTLFTIPKIPSFWDGGFVPNSNLGQLFLANERGNPELVGNVGGRTAVVNNNMIIEAIKGAMKSAIVEGMQLVFGNKPNGDMYVDIYIDGVFTERRLIDENEKKLLKTGKPVFFSK